MGKDNGAMVEMEQHYAGGDFAAARKLLMEKKDTLSEGLFHYNLGTLYAKEGNWALGRFHLEKAFSKNFANRMLFNNLEVVKSELNVLELGQGGSFSERSVDTSLSLPPASWLSLTLVMLLLWIISIKKRWLAGNLWRGIGLLVALIPLLYSQIYLERMRYAIVLEDTQIHEGPSDIYADSGIVRGGSKIIVGKSNNGRYLILYPELLSGWIHERHLGFL